MNKQPENYGIPHLRLASPIRRCFATANRSSDYRQCAVAFTDYWAAYGTVFPRQRHRAVGKETGKTSYIERFNNTLRQRVSRLVRKTLSFSKSLENHIGAIWYFVHHYNASLLL